MRERDERPPLRRLGAHRHRGPAGVPADPPLPGRDKNQHAFYLCWAPEGRPATMTYFITIAGRRWPVEITFKTGKTPSAGTSPRPGPGTRCAGTRADRPRPAAPPPSRPRSPALTSCPRHRPPPATPRLPSASPPPEPPTCCSTPEPRRCPPAAASPARPASPRSRCPPPRPPASSASPALESRHHQPRLPRIPAPLSAWRRRHQARARWHHTAPAWQPSPPDPRHRRVTPRNRHAYH